MNKTDAFSFYRGIASSFFIQPERLRIKTSHHLNESVSIGNNYQDWQKLAGDFNRATDKLVSGLDSDRQHHLNQVRYHYEPKTT